MSYFESNYDKLKFVHGTAKQPGLRSAQIGAVYAVAAHFSISKDPAVVVMPTGSGKSAVIMADCYLLRSKRVLILTPSKLLRDQIAEDFASLVSLKKFSAAPVDLKPPKVKAVSAKIDSADAWKELKGFDVVISTPNCISPEQPGVAPAPKDFFDVIFVDEAHHSPARTWIAILDAFPKAKKTLVTATPYRNDKKEINGKFVYVYGLRQAKADGIFGEIEFSPVSDAEPGNDEAVAKKAEAVINADRKAGLEHFLVVRTDSKKKADELLELYSKKTKLKLKVVHSGHMYRTIKTTIKELKEKKLDGVIAVAMLGEGFDFPNLKIAAIHAPHRSLAITLQFIGRFARTGNEKLGKAKFIAIPNDIKIESEKLYEEGASWEEIVSNLSETRIDSEMEIQEQLDSFETTGDVPEADDFSLSSLTPYSHVKVYQIKGDVDLKAEFKTIQGKEVIEDHFSDDLNARTILCRQELIPKWSGTESYAQIDHDLHVIFYHEDSKLLFINSSNKAQALYEQIAKAVADGHQILSLSEVNRVIRDVQNSEFFNIGMKNSVTGGKTESYRIISGPNAQQAVSRTDGALFHRGHVFGKGTSNGEDVTIGYSSASKVWAHAYVKIPVLIAWCKVLALRVMDESPVRTNSNLDLLQVGETITAIESPVLFADWNPSWLTRDVSLKNPEDDSYIRFWNAGITVLSNTRDKIVFSVEAGEAKQEFEFRLNEAPRFVSTGGTHFTVGGDEEIKLVDLFNSDPISFYLADLSRLRGRDIFRAGDVTGTLAADCLSRIDWTGTDITKETARGRVRAGHVCVHAKLEQWLVAQDYELVIFDDRAGEIADYVCIKREQTELKVELFHAKPSGAATAGARVTDLYEVCGQAAKSFLKTNRIAQVFSRLEERLADGSRFAKGDMALFRAIKTASAALRAVHQIFAVQPGVDIDNLTDAMRTQILATESFVTKIQDARFKLIGS